MPKITLKILLFLLSIYLWILFDQTTSDFQFVENRQWLSGFINYKVGIDGISILFIFRLQRSLVFFTFLNIFNALNI